MLRLPDRELSNQASAVLDEIQQLVDAGEDHEARVSLAKAYWSRKTSTNAHAAAFAEIRTTLSEMAYGSVRCAYCEDSAADEIEHIAPKTVVPSRAFAWPNYCYACGPCNGPKGNRHGIVDGAGQLVELDPKSITAEPAEMPALLDPRTDDYKEFLEIDIGGLTPAGMQLVPTSEFRVKAGLSQADDARARGTITVLKLNREVIRKARETALQSYRACLLEYADEVRAKAPEERLERLAAGIIAMPHPSVLNELLRQAATQPKVAYAITIAPEIEGWLR